MSRWVKPGCRASTFAYDDSAPLRVDDRGPVNPGYPVAVHDVSFAVPGGRVHGYLVVPPGSGKRPAAVYMHGGGGDRTELLVRRPGSPPGALSRSR